MRVYGAVNASNLDPYPVRDLWWQDFVERRDNCVGFDSSIIMSPKVCKFHVRISPRFDSSVTVTIIMIHTIVVDLGL